MYDNVGRKIKAVAKVSGYITAIVLPIIGLLTLSLGGYFLFALVPIVLWLSLLTYGFGQLVENSDVLAEKAREEKRREQENGQSEPRQP